MNFNNIHTKYIYRLIFAHFLKLCSNGLNLSINSLLFIVSSTDLIVNNLISNHVLLIVVLTTFIYLRILLADSLDYFIALLISLYLDTIPG